MNSSPPAILVPAEQTRELPAGHITSNPVLQTVYQMRGPAESGSGDDASTTVADTATRSRPVPILNSSVMPGPENTVRVELAPPPRVAQVQNPFPRGAVAPAPLPDPVFIQPQPQVPLPTPPPVPQSSGQQFRLPFATSPTQNMRISSDGELVSLTVNAAPLDSVLSLIAKQHKLNLVAGEEVKGNVTVALDRVPLDDALDALLKSNGYLWHRERNILTVAKMDVESQVSSLHQGRVVRVFPLNYIAAEDAERITKGLLSKVGKSFISQADPADGRRTMETIVVEDLPEYVARIENYLAQMDVPPRQVLIEAHVLQVDLAETLQHGINLQGLGRIANSQVTFQTIGLANPAATPAMLLGLNATDLTSVIEALQSTNDVKTLASPKLMVVNGQLAKIQIGSRFGYFTTTTTQTSTVQSVEFLDVGVVLNVTPTIANDGQVLLKVKPEISGGRINPISGLPEEDTTEVETTVMLQDGFGMVVGGLIKETDEDVQNKVPYIGDLWLVGKAFRRVQTVKRRTEIIIALIPRIVPVPTDMRCKEAVQLDQSTSPLLDKNLNEYDRRHWEGELHDAMKNPREIPFVPLPGLHR